MGLNKKLVLTSLLLFNLVFNISVDSFSQSQVNQAKLEKKAAKHLNNGEWYLALPLYVQLSEMEPTNAEYAITVGRCYFKTDKKGEALTYFLKASAQGYESDLLNFYLGRAYHFKLLFDSAITHYTKYLGQTEANNTDPSEGKPTVDEVNAFIKNCRFGNLLKDNPVKLRVENVGQIVNSGYPEYAPVVSADETMLMFTTRRNTTTGGGLDNEGRYFEDVYYTKKNDQGNWDTPQNIDIINTKYDDACIGLSPDGFKMLVFNGLNGGDIYVSSFENSKWSKPISLEGDVNSPFWEGSASFTLAEDIIYFSSDREGGFGGSDLYYSKKLPDGKWSTSVNLGPAINTPEDEDAPQIHANGKTLFFSSKGHDGIGGFDIFSSRLNQNDSTWSKPKNMGFPINTADDDIYFSLTADGSKGYFNSYRNDGYGEQDIYVVHRPLSSPQHVLLKGKIVDNSNNPLVALVTLTRQKDQLIEKMIKSDPKTGSYSFEMSFDRDYNLTVEVDGYFYFTENINIEMQPDIFEFVIDFTAGEDNNYVVDVYDGSESAATKNATNLNNIHSGEVLLASDKDFPSKSTKNISYREVVNYIEDETDAYKQYSVKKESELVASNVEEPGSKEINNQVQKRSLIPLEVGQKMVLNNIYFDFNKASLKPESKTELHNLYNLLQNNQGLYAEIAGHTDNIGSRYYNQQLSESRAQAVYDFLIEQGIDRKRLKVVGYGDSKPMVNNITPEGRKINRRTEFQVIDIEQSPDGFSARDSVRAENASFKLPVVVSEDLNDSALPIKAHFLFNNGSFLTDYSKMRLNTILEFTKQDKDLKLFIRGFEDVENEDSELGLRNLRAKTVYDYLINNGLAEERIEILQDEKDESHSSDKGILRRKVEFYISQ